MTAGILEYANEDQSKTKPHGAKQMYGLYTYSCTLLDLRSGSSPVADIHRSGLSWRADKELIGPTGLGFTNGEGIIQWALPFKINYLVVGHLITVVIYGLGLVANVALWSVWQNRGKVAPPEIEESTYGRPLLREGLHNGCPDANPPLPEFREIMYSEVDRDWLSKAVNQSSSFILTNQNASCVKVC